MRTLTTHQPAGCLVQVFPRLNSRREGGSAGDGAGREFALGELVVPAGGSTGRATVVATAAWARALRSARALSAAAVAAEPCSSFGSPMSDVRGNELCV